MIAFAANLSAASEKQTESLDLAKTVVESVWELVTAVRDTAGNPHVCILYFCSLCSKFELINLIFNSYKVIRNSYYNFLRSKSPRLEFYSENDCFINLKED